MRKFFDRSIDIAVRAGVEQDKIILDPGIGFGKTAEQNMEVLTRLDELTREFPFLAFRSKQKTLHRCNPGSSGT